jgi:hypothetical protein
MLFLGPNDLDIGARSGLEPGIPAAPVPSLSFDRVAARV